MKLIYTAANGRISFELDVATGKQAFELVAAIQELFEEPDCGKCQSKAIKCETREYDGNKYYNLRCLACGAQLDFGQHKVGGTLFAKRQDKETRKPLPNRGWYMYTGGARQTDRSPSSSRGDDIPY